MDAINRVDGRHLPTAAVRAIYPRRFGPYVLLQPLEDGLLDQVSLAFAGEAGTEVLCVVQRLPRQLSEDADLLARFREQAALARRLSHGNLVGTLGVGQIDREPFIAQEFVEGQDLAEVWSRCAAARARFPVELALYVVSQIARGLAYAHDFEGMGLVHGDLSPFKIRLAYSGEVRLLGFGLTGCKPNARSVGVAAAGRRERVAPYRAPEVLAGAAPDRRADVYALGVVLWELLTQRRYAGAESPVAPSQANPAVPAVLDGLVAKALSRRPDRRFQTAGELRAAIGERLSPGRDFEAMLGDFLGRLFDVAREREQRRDLVSAGETVRTRRVTGQNPLLPPKTNGNRAEDRTPTPLLVPAPEPPPPDGPGARRRPVRSRHDRYRLRVVASAAFALLTFATMVAVVIALRYAADHPGEVDLSPPRPAPAHPADATATAASR